MSEPDDYGDSGVLDPAMLVGVLANATRVSHGRDWFTLDFLRAVREVSQPILVARAVISPHVAFELRDQLDDALRRYSEWSMPEDASNG
ncbi:MAG TPA: DUF3467 domain-containing protein [Gaiellaceae bacterium]